MIISHTQWVSQLRMPAREVETSLHAPLGVGANLMRRHKTLPRPREEKSFEVYPSPPGSNNGVLRINTDVGSSSTPTSQSSSPHTLKHSSRRIGAPDLPPTPPTHSRQSSSGNATTEQISSADVIHQPSIPTTPPTQQSPPTPDVTPPKDVRRSIASLRPPRSDRYSSSRTDSFKTARETPSSSDEDEVSTVRPLLVSAESSEFDALRLSSRKTRARDVGLGLGLESDTEGTISPGNRPNTSWKGNADFGNFDGEWSPRDGEVSEVERVWDDNLMRNVTVRTRPIRKTYNIHDSPAGEVVDDNLISPTNATIRVREYSLDGHLSDSPKTITLNQSPFGGYAQPIQPASNANNTTEDPSTPDLRRLSAMSTKSNTSTIIEAIVVEPPPQRRKTLRHTKKQIGLRDFTSDQSSHDSGTEMSYPNEASHKLHRRTAKIPERHRSVQSNATASTSSSAKSVKARREVWNTGSIPVVVVPQRMSSMKSARTPSLRSTSSRPTRRSASLSSAPLSSTAKPNESGKVEVSNVSRSPIATANDSYGSQRTMDYPPQVPVRRSSLSAPTSRTTSRAGSLTAESLKAHDLSQALEAQKFQSSQDAPSTPRHAHTLSVDHNGDPLFGNRLSAQVTPFSQTSYETVGTAAEVAEALAVNLYPHQNKSVLVVQQQAQSSSIVPIGDLDKRTVAPTIAVEKEIAPTTPPGAVDAETETLKEVDSPLRNPREPPQPPAIRFIPPTPSNLTPAQEEDRQLGREYDRPSTSEGPPKRGLSLIRRALSNRRSSESALPSIRPARDRGNIARAGQNSRGNVGGTTRYPSVSDYPPDTSKLHPFWRPSRFWDDLEDEDSFFRFSEDRPPVVDYRPGLPKRSLSGSLKRTFAIVPIRDDPQHTPYWVERRTVRRTGSGNLRVVKRHGSNESLRRAISDSRYARAHLYDHDAGRKMNLQWMGLKSVARRMSEKRKEKRHDILRKSISAPRDAIDGVDNVLRGGQQQPQRIVQ